MSNPYKKTSKLLITTRGRGGQTILEDVFFTTPMKVTRPFQEADGALKIVTIAVSPGLLEGDVQELTFNILEGSNTIITSQSYEKIHKMKEHEAKRKIDIYVDKDASLKYVPLPTIPFAGSAFSSELKVELADNSSRFFMAEIVSSGRYARGEVFKYKYFKSEVTISKMGKLFYRDNTVFEPSGFDLQALGSLENHTHMATILIFNWNVDQVVLDNIREVLAKYQTDGGASYTWSRDVVVRIFGFSAQSLEHIIESVQNTIEEGWGG